MEKTLTAWLYFDHRMASTATLSHLVMVFPCMDDFLHRNISDNETKADIDLANVDENEGQLPSKLHLVKSLDTMMKNVEISFQS